MHVDEFIDRYTPITKFSSNFERDSERYARFVLMMFRLPAALAHDFEEFTPKLFCTYQGKTCRVVFASRFGWIGLTVDPNRDTYEMQANISDCLAWRSAP